MSYAVYYYLHSGPPMGTPMRFNTLRSAEEMRDVLKAKGVPIVTIERVQENKVKIKAKKKLGRFWV